MAIQLKSAVRDRQAARGQPDRGRRARPARGGGQAGHEHLGAERDRRQAGCKQLKAESAFLGYHGYPAVLCTSVNEVVVHGIPRKDVVLKDGDILSIDFGAFKDGWCGDSARTVPIGPGLEPRRAGADRRHARVAGAGHRRVRPRQPPGRHRLGRPVARRAAGLFGGPPVRRARDRPRHARGAPRPELRRRGQGARACRPAWWWPSSRWSTPGARGRHRRRWLDGCNQRW